jgi:hypothetical protein
MTRRLVGLSLTVAAIAACNGAASDASPDAAAGGAGTISGTVNGTKWTHVSSAYWIGKPSKGSAPLIAFLFEAPMDCATLVNPNWDKAAIGDKQLLELDLVKAMAGSFAIPMEADVAYLRGAFNPSADAGDVTIDELNANKNLVGSFDVTFMGDPLKGTFDATYCPNGVEP